MPLFKKKKEEKGELPELPSFSEMQQIKQAIKPTAMPQDIGLPEMSEASKIPARAALPAFAKPPLTQEIGEPATPPPAVPQRYEISQPRKERAGAVKLKEPIFIKIDNFKEALSNFELIKERLIEIDELLRKLKETRVKEQEEFDSWEKEVVEIKSKVDDIDERLFSNLE